MNQESKFLLEWNTRSFVSLLYKKIASSFHMGKSYQEIDCEIWTSILMILSLLNFPDMSILINDLDKQMCYF